MTVTDAISDPAPRKKTKLPLLIGLVLALAGGAGGFYAVQSGLVLGKTDSSDLDTKDKALHVETMPDVGFVPIEPLVILIDDSTRTHLRFRAELEVRSAHRSEVESLLPRVVDVLNSYLRAVDVADLRDNNALVRLRAQMLRRIQVVTGGDRVSDLLIMEFVLN